MHASDSRTSIIRVANAWSPHTRAWDPLVAPLKPEIFTIDSHPDVRRFLAPLRIGYATLLALFWGHNRHLRGSQTPIVEAHGAGRAGLIACLLPFPRVVIVHGSEVLLATTRMKRWLWRWTLFRADVIVVTSPSTSDFIRKATHSAAHKVFVVHPGIDWEDINHNSALSVAHPSTVVSIRRVLPLYGIGTLQAAFEGIIRINPDCRLTIIQGDSPIKSALVDRIRTSISQSPHTHAYRWIEEFLPQQVFRSLLRSHSVAVSLASSDQLSIAILEALAAGCVMVVTDLDAYGPLRDLPHVITVSRDASAHEVQAALVKALAVAERDSSLNDRAVRAAAAEKVFSAHWTTDYASVLSGAADMAGGSRIETYKP